MWCVALCFTAESRGAKETSAQSGPVSPWSSWHIKTNSHATFNNTAAARRSHLVKRKVCLDDGGKLRHLGHTHIHTHKLGDTGAKQTKEMKPTALFLIVFSFVCFSVCAHMNTNPRGYPVCFFI